MKPEKPILMLPISALASTIGFPFSAQSVCDIAFRRKVVVLLLERIAEFYQPCLPESEHVMQDYHGHKLQGSTLRVESLSTLCGYLAF